MPHKHSRKVYVVNGHYHVYNRGVDKRIIFQDGQDYRVFLHLLKYYLSPTENKSKHPLIESGQSLVRPRPIKNLHKEINLLAYCLMPNHFHLLIKQITKDGMTKLLQKLSTTYSMYFNRRHDRIGHLFQGRYKAALITKDPYLLHLSRYIHQNPLELPETELEGLSEYPYSSYPYYLRLKNTNWIKPEFILRFFRSDNLLPFLSNHPSYKKFVEAGIQTSQNSKKILGSLSID